MRFTAKVMKVGGSLALVLPKPICDGFGIEKGQVLDMIVDDGGVSIPLEAHLDALDA